MTSAFPAPNALSPAYRAAFFGALWGGALGDALGQAGLVAANAGAVEDLVAQLGSTAPVSSETQLTLYTLDGLCEVLEWNNDGQAADELACIWLAYLRWYRSTGAPYPQTAPFTLSRPLDTELTAAGVQVQDRAVLGALATGEMQFISKNVNPAELGTGVLARSVPFGFLPVADDATVIKLSAHAAALTHGHPEAIISASACALVTRYLLGSHEASFPAPARTSVTEVLTWLGTVEQKEALPGDAAGTISALETALLLADGGAPFSRAGQALGGLGRAPAALGAALYLLLTAEKEVAGGRSTSGAAAGALVQAVTLDGTGAVTAPLTGALLGARYTDSLFSPGALTGLEISPALNLVAGNWLKQLGLG